MNPSPSLKSDSRIDLIDGFRCIAAMWVVIYHYYWRFGSAGLGPEYPQWPFIRYGYFGVQLFFMISGFVIFHSLEKTWSFKEFIVKRYLRLAPALILCSLISYAFVAFWNDSARLAMYESRTPLDLLFSFTFLSPFAWNFILGRTDVGFVDMAYWSLIPEVIFYISAGLLYFNTKKENFTRNWFILVFILWIGRVCTSPKLAALTPGFLLPLSEAYYQAFFDVHIHQWIYFSIGVLVYDLWIKRNPSKLVWAIVAILFLFEMYFLELNAVRILLICSVILWAIFLYRPQWLSVLRWKPIQVIGLMSYPLYLLHESAGLVLAEKLIVWTNNSVPGYIIMIFVLIVFLLLSYFVFVFFEKPVTKALREKFLRRKLTTEGHAA